MKIPEKLWVLAHPEKGIVFALGNSAHNAWQNAIAVLYCETDTDEHYDILRASLRREGWRAVRVRLEEIS